jgi:hypothetical protein
MTVANSNRLFKVLMSDDFLEDKFECRLASMSNKRKKKFRMYLAIRQVMCCHYCKTTMTLQSASDGKVAPNYATFEHLIDIFVHGKKDDSASAIVLACAKCNSDRGGERVKQAFEYYSTFLNRITLHKLVRHVGWQRIINAFGAPSI